MKFNLQYQGHFIMAFSPLSIWMVLIFLPIIALMFPPSAVSQSGKVPTDFSLTLSSAPLDIRTEGDIRIESASIKADGTALVSARRKEDKDIPAKKIKLKPESLASIYDAVKRWKFFELKPLYEDPSFHGGDYVLLKVTANGTTHEVKVVNMRVRDFDRITWRINSALPKDDMVLYNVFYGVKYRMEVQR